MVEERFCSGGLADDPETIQKKHDRDENTKRLAQSAEKNSLATPSIRHGPAALVGEGDSQSLHVKSKVERFIPKPAAAPFEPATTPFICFNVLRI